DRRFGQQRAAFRNDIGKPAEHDVAVGSSVTELNADDARLDGRHQGRVVRHYGQLALSTGDHDSLDLLGNEKPLRRDELELEKVSHYFPALKAPRRSRLRLSRTCRDSPDYKIRPPRPCRG